MSVAPSGPALPLLARRPETARSAGDSLDRADFAATLGEESADGEVPETNPASEPDAPEECHPLHGGIGMLLDQARFARHEAADRDARALMGKEPAGAISSGVPAQFDVVAEDRVTKTGPLSDIDGSKEEVAAGVADEAIVPVMTRQDLLPMRSARMTGSSKDASASANVALLAADYASPVLTDVPPLNPSHVTGAPLMSPETGRTVIAPAGQIALAQSVTDAASTTIRPVLDRLSTVVPGAAPQRLTMVLQPEHLGEVEITIALRGNDVHLRIVTQTEAAFAALSGDRGGLGQIARALAGAAGEGGADVWVERQSERQDAATDQRPRRQWNEDAPPGDRNLKLQTGRPGGTAASVEVNVSYETVRTI